MTDEELREVTTQNSHHAFRAPAARRRAYQLWRQFDPELARHMSLFYTDGCTPGSYFAETARVMRGRRADGAPTTGGSCGCILGQP